MPSAPGTVLGGLPIIADVSFYRGDGWSTDDDAIVDAIYWRRRDGSKGKEIPQHVRDRAEEYDYGLCGLIEQVCDYLSMEEDKASEISDELSLTRLI